MVNRRSCVPKPSEGARVESARFQHMQVNSVKKITEEILSSSQRKIQMVNEVNEVRQSFIKVLQEIYANTSLVKYFAKHFAKPTGTFIIFLPYRDLADTGDDGDNDDEHAVHTLAKGFDAFTVPGFAFGMSRFIRVSYGRIDVSTAEATALALANGLHKIITNREVMP